MTNGITPRRWLLACNPGLSELVTEKVGEDWPKDLDKLQAIAKFADDAKFQNRFMEIKYGNKQAFADFVREDSGTVISTDALYDVQIKRLHEYKRQHFNLLHILTLYRRLLNDPDYEMNPRVFIFGAKAAPGYALAKNIIRAINKVGEKVNNDPRINGKIKIVFPQNYRITMAEKMIPAADLSEQISTAGKEASGAGNMKLALNGALTIGTLDGANVEIGEEVGKKISSSSAIPLSKSTPYVRKDTTPTIITIVTGSSKQLLIGCDRTISHLASRMLLRHFVGWLEGGDPFLCLADYADYVRVQEAVDKAFSDKKRWAKMAIMNTAYVGKFSSDRTIGEYAKHIWKLKPVKIGS